MKDALIEGVILLIMVFGVAGCAAPATTALQVFGDGGRGFSARMTTSNQRVLTVATVTKENEPHQVFETNVEVVSCDLRKEEKTARIVAQIVDGGRVVVRAESPPGTKGVRIEKVAGTWTHHTY